LSLKEPITLEFEENNQLRSVNFLKLATSIVDRDLIVKLWLVHSNQRQRVNKESTRTQS